jgi:hypothetical protein
LRNSDPACTPFHRALIVAAALALSLACKSPICRVGSGNGRAELAQWAHLDDPPGWFQNWQRYEDYRNQRIYIQAPDLELLCQAGCEGPKARIEAALQTHLIEGLKRQPGFVFVASRDEADFEIHLRIAQVREHHPIEYVSLLPPTDFYAYWFKVLHTRTGRTAFWASGVDFFGAQDHRRTYDRLIAQFTDFRRARG